MKKLLGQEMQRWQLARSISVIAGAGGGSVEWQGDLTALSLSKSYSIASILPGDATGMAFSPDGSHVYIACQDGTATIYQFDLSVPWDVSSASYSSKSFPVETQESVVKGVYVGDDGFKMYIIGNSNDTVFQYSLATAWDVASASYDGVGFSVTAQNNIASELFFRSDGLKMFYADGGTDRIYQYSLATAWDITSVSYDNASLSVGAQEGSPGGMFINPDGDKLYVSGGFQDTIFQYTLSTPWDISSGSYDGISIYVGNQDPAPRAIFASPDGLNFYIAGLNEVIYQYVVD